MKEGIKRRLALVLSAVFALTLVLNVSGANAETPTGNTYNTPTGNTYNTPTDDTYNTPTDDTYNHPVAGPTSFLNRVVFVDKSGKVQDLHPAIRFDSKEMSADEIYKALKMDQYESEVAQTYQGAPFTGFVFSIGDSFLTKDEFLTKLEKEKTVYYLDILAFATYGNKVLNSVSYEYPAKVRFGYKEEVGYFLLDKKKADDQSVIDAMNNFKPEDITSGLDFTWTSFNDFYYNNAFAKTTNFQVIYDILDPSVEYDPYETLANNIAKVESETLKSQIVTAGTKITLPSTIDGKAVKWLNVTSFNGAPHVETLVSGTTYTVNSNMSFQAVWDNGKPISVSNQTKTSEITYINNYVKAFESLPDDKKDSKTHPCYVAMNLATVVPHEYLDAVKGHDVDLVLEMGNYSWTINGKSIKDTSDINLEVRIKNAVPSDAVKSLAGSKPTKQLSLTHDGPLGFDATLTWDVGSENEGKFANLYWYKPDGTFEFVSDSKINKYGYAELKFTHASDYVIVISDKEMSAKEATAANEEIVARKIAEHTGKASAKATKSPKTGE